MHAGGRIGPQLGREGFARARRRFLHELAEALGSERTPRVTVVFDAAAPPRDFSLETTYLGLHLVFALGDEDADERIERILGQDSNPANLTVVSTDRRLRLAAARRRAQSMTAEEFWTWIDDLREGGAGPGGPQARVQAALPGDDPRAELTPSERAFWLETFRGLDEDPKTRDVLAPNASLLTDAEIAEIQREVDREP
jgi:hypothetical protein